MSGWAQFPPAPEGLKEGSRLMPPHERLLEFASKVSAAMNEGRTTVGGCDWNYIPDEREPLLELSVELDTGDRVAHRFPYCECEWRQYN